MPTARQRATCHPDRWTRSLGLCAYCYERNPKRMAQNRDRAFLKYHGRTPAERFAVISNRKAKERHGITGQITAASLAPLDDGCAYCAGPATEWDHVIPLSRGGAHHGSNLVPCCDTCNRSKQHRTPEEWLAAGLYGELVGLKAA